MKTTTNRFSVMSVTLSLGLLATPLMAADADMAPGTRELNQDTNAAANEEMAEGEMKDGQSDGSAVNEKAMEDNMADTKMTKSEKTSEALSGVNELIASIQPVNDSNVMGSVMFEKVSGGVKVTAKVGGLEPNTKHGFHIHQFGDITAADGTSAGGHYNPEGHDHALPTSSTRHAGDLGNLEADGDGNASLTLTVDNISLAGDMNPIIGRAVIIHAKTDDGGQPTGNAGDRIGAGVIGIGSVDDGKGESAMAE